MPDEFERVAEVSEIPQGTIKVVKLGENEVSIANVEGEFFAFPNKCTHLGGPVGRGKLNGSVIQCPWHGSKFDVRTGAVVGPPATIPLKTFVVKVENNLVYLKSSDSNLGISEG